MWKCVIAYQTVERMIRDDIPIMYLVREIRHSLGRIDTWFLSIIFSTVLFSPWITLSLIISAFIIFYSSYSIFKLPLHKQWNFWFMCCFCSCHYSPFGGSQFKNQKQKWFSRGRTPYKSSVQTIFVCGHNQTLVCFRFLIAFHYYPLLRNFILIFTKLWVTATRLNCKESVFPWHWSKQARI